MDDIYKAIEMKIKASGYPLEVDGAAIYNDICDEIDEKENGTYLLLSKYNDIDVFEYQVNIFDEDFNLSALTITTPSNTYYINFDE